MNRYGFNVKTRSGQRVDNIVIMAASRGDAERRLRADVRPVRDPRMPRAAVAARRAVDTLDVEAVIGLISAGPRSQFSTPVLTSSSVSAA